MNVKWIGSPNFDKGRFGHVPSRVVWHIMQGTLVGADSWFNNKKSYVSAHYGIGKDGTIHQYVQETDTAWACAPYAKPTSKYLFLDLNPNFYTINIEFEGKSGDTPTDAQISSAQFLSVGFKARWNIDIDRIHYMGHGEINSVSRKGCPGFSIDWLLGRINLIVNESDMNQINELNQTVNSLKAVIINRDNQISQYDADEINLKAQIGLLTQANTDLLATHEKDKISIDTLQRDSDTLDSENNELQKKIDTFQNSFIYKFYFLFSNYGSKIKELVKQKVSSIVNHYRNNSVK